VNIAVDKWHTLNGDNEIGKIKGRAEHSSFAEVIGA